MPTRVSPCVQTFFQSVVGVCTLYSARQILPAFLRAPLRCLPLLSLALRRRHSSLTHVSRWRHVIHSRRDSLDTPPRQDPVSHLCCVFGPSSMIASSPIFVPSRSHCISPPPFLVLCRFNSVLFAATFRSPSFSRSDGRGRLRPGSHFAEHAQIFFSFLALRDRWIRWPPFAPARTWLPGAERPSVPLRFFFLTFRIVTDAWWLGHLFDRPDGTSFCSFV